MDRLSHRVSLQVTVVAWHFFGVSGQMLTREKIVPRPAIQFFHDRKRGVMDVLNKRPLLLIGKLSNHRTGKYNCQRQTL